MTISILGCGWLGLPLAETLIRSGHTVRGSTTSPGKMATLQKKGIDPYLFALTPRVEAPKRIDKFWESQVLVINIPPGRKREDVERHHTAQIRSILEAVDDSAVQQIVFVSSTSVYPAMPGTVTEDDAIAGNATRSSGNALLKAEQLLRGSGIPTTVLRFGGLIGGDRNPARYLAGRTGLRKANAPVNLIHRDDCIAIISQIIDQQITGEVFNAVADGHPSRKVYYTRMADKLGLEPPEFNDEKSGQRPHKVVDSEKLKQTLSYTFKHKISTE